MKSLSIEAAKYENAVRAHIRNNLHKCLKEPKACLKYPFVDPGSVYDGNLWDWDSYWAVYGICNLLDGLGDSAKIGGRTRGEYLNYARGNVRNFFDHQLGDGYIPMMIEVSDKETPYLNRKHAEGVVMNMHKPFLAQQICLISEFSDDFEWAREYKDKLEAYFGCYDRFYFNGNCGLYVWADDIMIGMDNDPASFGRPQFSTANIFLNSFMVAELRAMSRVLAGFGDTGRAREYLTKANTLAAAIQTECWDPRDKFFYSVDVDIRTRQFDWFHKGLGVFWKTLPIKIRAWSGFLPLWAEFATTAQAVQLRDLHALDPETFHSPSGIRSLARDEKMYDLRATNNPSNWLGPIWIVVNYAVFRGLMNYGFEDEAHELCEKTLALLGRDLETTGTLHEYYDPESGKPVMNGGFINWNILALNMADELRGKKPMSRIGKQPLSL